MKTRILAVGLLSMVGWALSASNASALFLLPRCHRNYSVIVCRPYNAFTPICCGTVVCDGCCSSPFCGGGSCAPIQRSLGPNFSGGCCDGGCTPYDQPYAAAGPMMMPGQPMPYAAAGPMMMPGQPMQMPMQQMPVQMPSGPNFTPPPPTASPEYNQTSLRWNPQGVYGVQPAGYYPAYPMNYYPVNNYPAVPAMPAPYYWYNGR